MFKYSHVQSSMFMQIHLHKNGFVSTSITSNVARGWKNHSHEDPGEVIVEDSSSRLFRRGS